VRRSASVTVLIVIAFVGVIGSTTQAGAAQVANQCGLGALPAEIQSALPRDFSGWKIQQNDNLGKTAMSSWSARKPAACPGLAVGEFDGTDTASYALLLVPARAGERGYILAIYMRESVAEAFRAKVIEKSSDQDGSSFFIRSDSVAKSFSEASRKKYRMGARDVIKMIDAGESAYGVDVYFWSNGRFQSTPMDE
jgi:hypothetical protein